MSIRIEALGGLRVLLGNEEHPELRNLRSRLALLVYLAIEQTATRDAVKAVFWPESDASTARHALRQALYRLRTVAGDGLLQHRSGELRATTALISDVVEFRAAVANCDWRRASLLYNGPFLEAVHLIDTNPWNTWIDVQRASLARDFRRSCRAWVDECLEAIDVKGALDAARHWVVPEPFDDEAHHTFIELLALTGNRAAALVHFEAYSRVLERDGLTPLEETADLASRIQRNDFSASAKRPLVRAKMREHDVLAESSQQAQRATRGAAPAVPTSPTNDESPPRRGLISRSRTAAAFVGAVAVLSLLGVPTFMRLAPRHSAATETAVEFTTPARPLPDVMRDLITGAPPADSIWDALIVALEFMVDPANSGPIPYLERAASDTTFTLAQLELASWLCCSGSLRIMSDATARGSARVDALLDRVQRDLPRLQPAARDYYRAVRYLVAGQRRDAWGEFRRAAEAAPERYGAIAAKFAAEFGSYDEALEIGRRVPSSLLTLQANGFLAMDLALHARGDFEGELQAARAWQAEVPTLAAAFMVYERRAIGAMAKPAVIDSFLSRHEVLGSAPNSKYRHLAILGEEAYIHGHIATANDLLDRAINLYETELVAREWHYESLTPFYLRARYPRLLELLKEYNAAGHLSGVELTAWSGLVAAREGRVGDAQQAATQIREDTTLSRPDRLMWLARISAVAGRTQDARQLVRQAVGAGFIPFFLNFVAYDLESIRDEPVIRSSVALE